MNNEQNRQGTALSALGYWVAAMDTAAAAPRQVRALRTAHAAAAPRVWPAGRLLAGLLLGALLLTACGGGGGNDTDGRPGLSIADAAMSEGDDGSALLAFTITLDATASEPVTVDYTSADGSAAAGEDYQAASGKVTIAAGDTTATVVVSVEGDGLVEPDETFIMTLSNASANARLDDAAADGIILNDDVPPAVTSVDPVDGEDGAWLESPVRARFTKVLDGATVNVHSFTVTGPTGPVNGNIELNASGTTARFTPDPRLAFGTDYSVRLSTEIRDLAGNPLEADHVWRFNTGTKLALGYNHTCARHVDGDVKCWGYNANGNLGLGHTDDRGDDPGETGNAVLSVNLDAGRPVTQLAAGAFHTCARLLAGQVKCWGHNASGELGLGDTDNRGDMPGEMGAALAPLDLGAGRVVQLALGEGHSCARLDDGAVKCWGLNNDGQLGLGDRQNRGDDPGEMGAALPAVDLGSGRRAVQIVAARFYTCARLDDGSVKCWGYNGSGELGLGDTDNRGDDPGEMGDALPAVDVGTGRTVVQLTGGGDQTCVQFDDGALKCWGYNADGTLGLGDTEHRGDDPGEMGDALPLVDLGAGARATQIVAGYGHTCARLDDGSARCWGYNMFGQLGQGDMNNRGDQPGEMGDDLDAIALGVGTVFEIAAGEGHSCAHLEDGAIKCWGYNGNGQLGLGDNANRGDQALEMGDALPPVDLVTP